MKTLLFALLLLGVFGSTVCAECAYFRTGGELLKCEVIDSKSLHTDNAYQPVSDSPELEEPPAMQAMVRVTCNCAYSLMGSDPRCDTDQTFERSSEIVAEKPATACRRGSSLCRDVCPPRLP